MALDAVIPVDVQLFADVCPSLIIGLEGKQFLILFLGEIGVLDWLGVGLGVSLVLVLVVGLGSFVGRFGSDGL